MIKVKICGITNAEDAFAAAGAGCDALGFIFYKKSPRYIDPASVKKIIQRLPERVLAIGVFVNGREKNIKHIARRLGLDMLQFHGNESPEFCRRFNGYKIIKAFRVRNTIDRVKVGAYHTFAYLFDAFSQTGFGGTGKRLCWSLVAKDIKGLTAPVFLSGGLDEHNVRKAIQIVRPAWVDASSRLEARIGKKDKEKVKKFVTQVKQNTGSSIRRRSL